MSDRLARRGFFALLASLPTMLFGVFGGRRVVPPVVAELPAAPPVETRFLDQVVRLNEQLAEQSHAANMESVRMLREQNQAMVEQQLQLVKMMRSFTDREQERRLAELTRKS